MKTLWKVSSSLLTPFYQPLVIKSNLLLMILIILKGMILKKTSYPDLYNVNSSVWQGKSCLNTYQLESIKHLSIRFGIHFYISLIPLQPEFFKGLVLEFAAIWYTRLLTLWAWQFQSAICYILNTQPIAKISSIKNERALVSMVSHKMYNRHPLQLKKLKSWEPF